MFYFNLLLPYAFGLSKTGENQPHLIIQLIQTILIRKKLTVKAAYYGPQFPFLLSRDSGYLSGRRKNYCCNIFCGHSSNQSQGRRPLLTSWENLEVNNELL